MKRDLMTGVAVILIVTFCWLMTPSPTLASDTMINAKISSMTISKDKNGAEFVRFIVNEPRELSGVKYERSIPVLAFREQVVAAKGLKAGETLKAVVQKSVTPDGRESYRIVSFAPVASAKTK
jgi:hypothetical protein